MKRKVLVAAHRGSSGLRPENTIASFKKAVECGADGVEFDVHLSSDDIPVVIHDETLDRTTNGSGLVKNASRKNLGALDAGTHFDPVYREEGVPALREVLDVVKDISVINIELKNNIIKYEKLEEKVMDIVNEFDLLDKIIFSSFNHYSVVKIKEQQPSCQAGILYYGKIYQPWEYAKYLGVRNIHPHYSAVDSNIVKKCREQNISINVFGTNDKAEISRLIDMRVNMVICDYPETVMKLRD